MPAPVPNLSDASIEDLTKYIEEEVIPASVFRSNESVCSYQSEETPCLAPEPKPAPAAIRKRPARAPASVVGTARRHLRQKTKRPSK